MVQARKSRKKVKEDTSVRIARSERRLDHLVELGKLEIELVLAVKQNRVILRRIREPPTMARLTHMKHKFLLHYLRYCPESEYFLDN